MFHFPDLDEKTREHMLQAISDAEAAGQIYFSTKFNQHGTDKWIPLLHEAASQHNEHWLAYQIEAGVLMDMFEGSATPSGGYTIKHVPHNASETLAEGQFARFYMIGLARRAISEDVPELEVYRAKEVALTTARIPSAYWPTDTIRSSRGSAVRYQQKLSERTGEAELGPVSANSQVATLLTTNTCAFKPKVKVAPLISRDVSLDNCSRQKYSCQFLFLSL